jgi:hypothetical protein
VYEAILAPSVSSEDSMMKNEASTIVAVKYQALPEEVVACKSLLSVIEI